MSITDLTPWAQFVCTTDNKSDPITVMKNKFIIGRSKTGNDLCLEGNKLVSAFHCWIERDDSGKVWLQDTSTNGTFINQTEHVLSRRAELKHGDQIHIVFKTTDSSDNVGYVFQDLQKLREEDDDGSSSELEMTQEYDVEENAIDHKSQKRDLEQESDSEEHGDSARPSAKRVCANTAQPGSADDHREAPPDSNTADDTNNLAERTERDDKSGATSDDKMREVEEGETSQISGGSTNKDAFEWNITCVVCQEIMHDCISLQPCMHSFCAGCYSDWMARSSNCPSCRMKVERVNKNHIVNNLVEAYLNEHPEKKRSEEELKELDAKNKITADMLYANRPDSGSSSVVYSDTDADDDSSEDIVVPTRVSYHHIPSIPQCRECPGYIGSPLFTSHGHSGILHVVNGSEPQLTTLLAAARSDPGVVTPLSPPAPHRCSPQQTHVLCACCFQKMPDKRAAPGPRPPQQCSLCSYIYCHLYWGCRNAFCFGCLCKFKDLNIGAHSLPVLVLGNTYESNILKDYLDTKKMTIADLLRECCLKLDTEGYTWNGVVINMRSDSIVCYRCALKHFSQLAYQYRAAIPANQLPAGVGARRDCYWGWMCRTQVSRPHHAVNFNHICEQTRRA